MKLSANLSLEGEYTVDVYHKNGEHSYSIGPKKNFITSTGLSYISNFAIADCFRYLSFGNGTAVNTLNGNNGWGTVYLQNIIPQLSYIGGRDTITDSNHVRSQYEDAGFTETISGVKLTRSWRVPSGFTAGGDIAVFDADYSLQEVMLSPGRGYETCISNIVQTYGNVESISINQITDSTQIWTTNQWKGCIVILTDSVSSTQKLIITSNTDTTINFSSSIADISSPPYTYEVHEIHRLCYGGDEITDIDGLQRQGIDRASIVSYYSGTAHKDICSASGAFARMVQTIPVFQDDYLIFTYNLNVNFETGFYPFNLTINNSRGALSNPSLWKGVTGIHQLIHHGIKLISDGTVVSPSPFLANGTTQDDASSWNADYDYGESFIGPWGCPLEPSTLGSRLSAYLTSDNLQFYANSVDGGAYISTSAGFSGTSGLMAWRQSPYLNPPSTNHYNIRRLTSAYSTPVWPVPNDYTTETDSPISFDHNVQIMTPTFDTNVTYSSFATPSSRTRSVTRAFQFAGRDDTTNFANVNDGLTPFAQIRGIVLAYQDPLVDTDSLIPYLDCLIMDSGVGVAGPKQNYRLLPQKDAPSLGKYTTGDVLGNPGSASYWPYLEGDAKLTFTFTETWGSPCSETVEGCPGYVP